MTLDVMEPAEHEASPQIAEQIAPEILAVIAAAATAMLGAHIRMGSVELQHDPAAQVSRWMRQGRANIQASHNLRTKR